MILRVILRSDVDLRIRARLLQNVNSVSSQQKQTKNNHTYLTIELIARKGGDDESIILVLLIERLQLLIVSFCETTLGRHVHNQHHFTAEKNSIDLYS